MFTLSLDKSLLTRAKGASRRNMTRTTLSSGLPSADASRRQASRN